MGAWGPGPNRLSTPASGVPRRLTNLPLNSIVTPSFGGGSYGRRRFRRRGDPFLSQLRHHLVPEQGIGPQDLFLGQVAESESWHEVVAPRLKDVPLDLVSDEVRCAEDHGFVLSVRRVVAISARVIEPPPHGAVVREPAGEAE